MESFTEHPATKDVTHIQKDGNLGERTYAEELSLLCEQSGAKIEAGEREVPESWEPDLYRALLNCLHESDLTRRPHSSLSRHFGSRQGRAWYGLSGRGRGNGSVSRRS